MDTVWVLILAYLKVCAIGADILFFLYNSDLSTMMDIYIFLYSNKSDLLQHHQRR